MSDPFAVKIPRVFEEVRLYLEWEAARRCEPTDAERRYHFRDTKQARTLGPMARRITETHYGFNRYAVWVEVGGTHYRAELRAWAIDDSPEGNESDVWWALCNWHDGHGQASIDWFPASRVGRMPGCTAEEGRALRPSNVIPLRRRSKKPA